MTDKLNQRNLPKVVDIMNRRESYNSDFNIQTNMHDF